MLLDFFVSFAMCYVLNSFGRVIVDLLAFLLWLCVFFPLACILAMPGASAFVVIYGSQLRFCQRVVYIYYKFYSMYSNLGAL